jgi:hypothetical protein
MRIMTQYMLTVHMVEGAPVPSDEVMHKAYRQVEAVNAEMMEKKVWVFAGGLHEASTATVVRAEGDEIQTTDGPFAEGKEHVGGFWVIDAEDLDDALAWAAKASRACMDAVEVRPFQDVPA